MSNERYTALVVFGACVFLNLAQVFLTVELSYFNRDFVNAMVALDRAGLFRIGITFIAIICIMATRSVGYNYLLKLLQIKWRQWMTDYLT